MGDASPLQSPVADPEDLVLPEGARRPDAPPVRDFWLIFMWRVLDQIHAPD